MLVNHGHLSAMRLLPFAAATDKARSTFKPKLRDPADVDTGSDLGKR